MKTNRLMRRWVVLTCIAGVLAGGRFAAAQNPSPTETALALRFCELGLTAARVAAARNPDRPDDREMREAADLLDAARRCDPTEPRYPWLLAHALRILDTVGAPNYQREIDALNAFRKLRPADVTAQLDVIGLFSDHMETVDKKLQYLAGLLGRDVIPPEVRAAVAMRCASLLWEKKRDEEMRQMVEQALKLDPLNYDALRLSYRTLPASATHLQRITLLLGMVRSNPAGLLSIDQKSPEFAMTFLGRELARAGLVNESIAWYDDLRRRFQVDWNAALDYVAELLIAGRTNLAQQALDEMLRTAPDDHDVLILRYEIERQAGKPEEADKFRARARNALLNELAIVRQQLGVKTATTQPVAGPAIPLPDLSGDVELYRKSSNAVLNDVYLQTIGGIGWFEAYFDKNRAEAETLLKHLEVLSAASGGKAADFAARLAGWVFLLEGRPDEAKVKLSAIADRDPMACLGLIRTYGPQEQDKARAAAEKLLADNPAGVLGAILCEAVRQLGVKVVPAADAPAIQAALAKFPRGLLQIVEKPWDFYVLRGDPVKVSYLVGEPMLARVTIQNTSDFDLTIGEDGVIRPELWFDAQVRGLDARRFPGICEERITEQRILKPRQTISLTVQIDQGPLAHFLNSKPLPPITIAPSVTSNPIPWVGTEMVHGPCGYTVTFARLMERIGLSPVVQTRGRIEESLGSGNPADRFLALQQAAILSAVMRRQAADTPEKQKENDAMVDALVDRLRRAKADADPVNRIWALFLRAVYGPTEERPQVVAEMLKNSDWRARLLGMAVMPVVVTSVDQRKADLEPLLKDPDANVRDYAAAAMDLINRPPTTQPASTQPATRPSLPIHIEPGGFSPGTPAGPTTRPAGDPPGPTTRPAVRP